MRPSPCCEIPDSKIEEIKLRFGFWPGYQTSYLLSNIEQAAIFYYEDAPRATAKQRGKRLRRIHQLATKLLEQLGAGVDFPDVEPVGIRRPLIALRDAASQHAAESGQAAPEQGRRPRNGTRSFVQRLQFTFLQGTGHTELYTWDPYTSCYHGGLLEFIREVAPLCGIAISDSSIVDMIQELQRSGSLHK